MKSGRITLPAVGPAGRPCVAPCGVWSMLAVACFWAYLVTLTVATHVPRVDPTLLAAVDEVSPLQPDKMLHLTAYGVLGALAGVAFARGRNAAAVIRLFVMLACWGFLDEFTQPLFGRGADVWDWFHDVAGLAIGLACAVAVHHWRASVRHVSTAGAEPARSA